uniref:Uncharacterized protein n=1 Tax=Glossina pallidipes TaxID=7398 RepID=A0A1A9ZFX4_GLOPL
MDINLSRVPDSTVHEENLAEPIFLFIELFLIVCCKENYFLQICPLFPPNSFSPATPHSITVPVGIKFTCKATSGLEMADCVQRRVQIPINDDSASSSFDLCCNNGLAIKSQSP